MALIEKAKSLAISSICLVVLICSCNSGGSGSAPITMSLSATVNSPSEVALSWTSHTEPVTGYDLFRNGTAAYPYHIAGNSYTDTNLDAETRYCYVVYAVTWPLGIVAKSNQACVTTSATAGWPIEIIGNGEYISSDLGSDASTHISYRQADGVHYASNKTGAWTFVLIDGDAGGLGHTAIDIDQSGSVHASYHDYTSGGVVYTTDSS